MGEFRLSNWLVRVYLLLGSGYGVLVRPLARPAPPRDWQGVWVSGCAPPGIWHLLPHLNHTSTQSNRAALGRIAIAGSLAEIWHLFLEQIRVTVSVIACYLRQ